MSGKPGAKGVNRRDFLKAGAVVAGASAALPLLAACAQPAPAPTKPAASAPTQAAPAAGAATPAPAAATTKPAAAPVAGGTPKQVARNRTFKVMHAGISNKYVEAELWNPYAVGANHQILTGVMCEPLAFYSAFADKEILWLAESYKYTPDFKELTIKTRSGVTWSDGTPFSAEDVAYTFTTLKELGPKVKWGVDVQNYVSEAKATDPNTVVVKFKVPAPRFFETVTYKYDIGVYIVPKHIFQGQDWTTFKHYDPEKGWPVTTSPWRVITGTPEQKVVDRRDEWWAAKAGLAKMPRIERIVHVPYAGEQQAAQALITNELDYSVSLQPSTFKMLFQQNPKLITHSMQKPPFGYLDWWPIAMYVNNEVKPFDNKDLRWALSYFIDRDQVVEIGEAGAGRKSPLPFPDYPGLRPYFEGIKDLLQKYDTNEFNPAKGAELLTKNGYKKNQAGMWADAQGNLLKFEIIIPNSSWSLPICPVIVEQLKRQGVDATFATPPDHTQRFTMGQYTASLYGHGGSVRDPWATLRLYQGASLAVPGDHQANFARWKNADYDKVVDEIYTTDMNDKTKLVQLVRKAMEIWLPELPDIQINYLFHRPPMNTTYWTNYPTEQNPYINGCSWHLTYNLMLWNLDPVS
jgi:peptide/nickel transport system substrate-binding protein